jgi:hypothetical protein
MSMCGICPEPGPGVARRPGRDCSNGTFGKIVGPGGVIGVGGNGLASQGGRPLGSKIPDGGRATGGGCGTCRGSGSIGGKGQGWWNAGWRADDGCGASTAN